MSALRMSGNVRTAGCLLITGLMLLLGASLAAPASATAPAPIALTSSSCPTDIEQGQVSGCVTELQLLLNQHGFSLTVDGDFGTGTLTAVKSFQSGAGLSADGIVGPATKAALSSTPPAGGNGNAAVVSAANSILAGPAIQYVWGGGHASTPGPSTGTCVGDPQSLSCSDPAAIGLDCSGFARWAYYKAGFNFGSGNTHNQVTDSRGSSVSGWTSSSVGSAQPGDLVFFGGTATYPDHVGIYLGNGKVADAPETGENVELDNVSRFLPITSVKHYAFPS
ncbi:MAG: NlpC/P60 family protein [Actinomycetota bacterium]|nr:NlpC/P60 family protein [Actinomycetota bacterium]